MRLGITSLFLLFVILAVEVSAESGPTVINPGGGCQPTPERPCPPICDVLNFEGIGDLQGGSCTIVIAGCTPLPGSSTPSCGTAQVEQAHLAGRSTLNQFAPGSTRLDAAVTSTQLGRDDTIRIYAALLADAGVNAIIHSFDGPPTMPPGVPPPAEVSGQVPPPGLGSTHERTLSLGDSRVLTPRDDTTLPPPPDRGSGFFAPPDGFVVPDPVRHPWDIQPGAEVGPWADQWRSPTLDYTGSRLFVPPSSSNDLTSGDNWGEVSLTDSGRALDAQTWEEWERRMALQTLVGDQVLQMVDGTRLETLESQLEGLRDGYRRDSPQYQALDAALACVRSEECATYTDAMRRITNGLGIYGASAHDFVDRFTDHLESPDMLRRYVLPADLTTEDENRQMDLYIAIMRQPPEVLEAMGIQPGMTFGEVDERLREIRHEMRMYEYDVLALAERENEDVVQPFFEAERQRRLDEEAALALEEYNRVARQEAEALSEQHRLEEIGRLLTQGWEDANRIVDRALQEAAAETARLAEEAAAEAARLAREAWNQFSLDEWNLSRTLTVDAALPCTYPMGPSSYCLQIDPATGMMRVVTGSGYWRTYDEALNAWTVQMNDHWTALVDAENSWYAEQRRIAERQAELAATGQITAPVNFDYDSWVIRPDSETSNFQAYLRTVGSVMTSDVLSGRTFQVIGYTDSFGPDAYNQRLSELRAQAVVNYLVEQNPSLAGRLTPIGCGERSQLATAEASRRVVFSPGNFQQC